MKFAALLFPCGLLCFATDSPKAIFDRAVQSLAAGDYAAAEQGFESVLRLEPRNVGAIGNLGILYARTNRPAQAIAEYQKALRLSPNDEPILLNLGLAYFKQDRHSAALPYFEQVVKLDAHNRQARQLLAVCRLYTGQLTNAIHELESLRSSDRGDEQLLFLLGFAYLKNGDAAAAQTIFSPNDL